MQKWPILFNIAKLNLKWVSTTTKPNFMQIDCITICYNFFALNLMLFSKMDYNIDHNLEKRWNCPPFVGVNCPLSSFNQFFWCLINHWFRNTSYHNSSDGYVIWQNVKTKQFANFRRYYFRLKFVFVLARAFFKWLLKEIQRAIFRI